MERRDFLKSAVAAAGAAVTGAATTAEAAPFFKPPFPPAQAPKQSPVTRPEAPGMIYRQLGTTGERVSAIGMGGAHLGGFSPDEATRLVHAAVDAGITFLDNCWDYSNGNAEVNMGAALSAGNYRQKVFLMTKMDGRTASAYNAQLDDSLRRLKTDHIDLVQFHEIIRMEDPDRVFAEGGCLEAAIAARKAGKIRYIGFTGHKDPAVHLRMFETAARHNFKFDTAQMPINVMDAHFRSFLHGVVPVAIKQGTGVLAMKTFGDKILLKSNTFQPMDALHFSLTQPVSVVITGIDKPEILQQALEAARTFKPMSEAQMASVLGKTRDAAMTGKFELFKTTNHFDGTAKNPQWLG